MSKRKQAVSAPIETLAALAAPAAPAATHCPVAARMATQLRAGRDITVGLAADVVILVTHHATPKDAGAALKAAWETAGEKTDTLPIRMLVEACYLAGVTRADASPLLNAVKAATKQRVSQLLAVVYDGDKSKNKGKATKGGKADKATKADKAAPEGGKTESQDGLDSLSREAAKAAPKAAPTVDDILALIAELPALTAADAARIAVALKGKLA